MTETVTYKPMFGDARISYAIFGALFGLCFPIIATIFDVLVQGNELTWANLVIAQRNQPLHWVIDSAPLFLGLFSYLAGRKQHEVMLINEGLEDQVRQRTLQLSEQNEELRVIHLELQDGLERISQSINYAQRIQNAIISDVKEMQLEFPESAIFFKPRDVVSGDFPWFLKKGDDYYFAAVDCTGHGVPGAFMSLIGYFLLNRIVRDQGVEDTGEILCALHLAVVNVLNQQTNKQVHDGMDLALCKVNRIKGEIQFSGACNPVYHISQGKLDIYNGDIWSIGGTQYKKRCPYTSKTFKFKSGDTIVMFTDGVTDQFDQSGKDKFGFKRIQHLANAERSSDMQHLIGEVDREITSWMGDHRQMDDMLLMAVKV